MTTRQYIFWARTKNGGKYNITSEVEQPDGSVIIDIKKQYNTSPVGTLLD